MRQRSTSIPEPFLQHSAILYPHSITKQNIIQDNKGNVKYREIYNQPSQLDAAILVRSGFRGWIVSQTNANIDERSIRRKPLAVPAPIAKLCKYHSYASVECKI